MSIFDDVNGRRILNDAGAGAGEAKVGGNKKDNQEQKYVKDGGFRRIHGGY